jgi:sec-independent protein translocase protein TatA
MFDSIGMPELILILLVVLVFFGAGKLPQIGEAAGKAIRSFKRAQAGLDEEPEKVVATVEGAATGGRRPKKTTTEK